MHATFSNPTSPSVGNRHLLATTVDGDTLTVRATAVWPIAEVLDFERSLDDSASLVQTGDVDAELIADALDSRMILPPRLRRRQRAVSSRAMFYAGG